MDLSVRVDLTAGESTRPGGIDRHQAGPGLDQMPSRGPYPAAQCQIKSDAAFLVQQVIRTLQRVLSSPYAQSGVGRFDAVNFNHCAASFAVPVPSWIKPPLIILVPVL
ncbi:MULTISPECIES: hypothetical protein [unclassified Mesorhizobium]|uniref:hypothetical protein n=1 Tax=unclassified Mesorhizobium TaxID=325217 RepID=UPI0013E2B8C0|nr:MULTISPECIES: hypothetical protein [unclassified Mesorhizobium]